VAAQTGAAVEPLSGWADEASGASISEGQVWLSIIRPARVAQPGGTAGSFHGQDQDQEGLVQRAVMELGRSAEGVGHEALSVLQVFQDGRFQFHKRKGQGLMGRVCHRFRGGLGGVGL
jgi:hypothetical protein